MEKEKTLLVPKEGNTLEMFLNVSQKDLCCILDSNPSLKKILEMDLSFGDYIKIIASTADKIEGVREKKEKLVKHINCFLGKFNNEISISDLPSIVNTGDHYGILSEKAPFYGELIYEKYLEELGKDKILSLAWENISMNNPSFPRGIILDEKSKIAFVADKYKHLNFSDGCVKIKDKKEIIKQIDQSKLSEKIKEKIKNILESNKEEDLVRIVYLINYQLWKEINNKEFHMIPFVKIITDYLLENKELFTELFLNNPQIIKKHLEGKFGGYSVIDGKTKGTSIGYYIIKIERTKSELRGYRESES